MNHQKTQLSRFFSSPKNLWWIAPFLALIVFSPSLNNGWVNWDDPAYVLENTAVHHLSWEGVKTMFSTPNVVGNYHPITLLSLAIDYAFDGPNAKIFHWHSLLLHLLNTILVFLLSQSLLKKPQLALLAALVFALHPMHTESVAWVSARKDLLYTLYLLLGSLSYIRYLRCKSESKAWRFLALCFLFFCLALLSKSMAIVFPAYLLLFDYLLLRKFKLRLFLEKTPFAILSLAFIWITLYTQELEGAIAHNLGFTWIQTTAIALYSIFFYLYSLFLPFKLSAFHPYPFQTIASIPNYIYTSLVLAPILISILIWAWKKNQRLLLFALLFFLISIAPVLQFLPHGRALLAERYTYLSYLGPILFLSQKACLALENNRFWLRKISLALLLLLFIAMGITSFAQVSIWRNGITLWTDVINQYPADYFAYSSRAEEFAKAGKWDASFSDIQQSIKRYPYFCSSLNLRGRLLEKKGKIEEAIQDYKSAIEAEPRFKPPYTNLAKIWGQQNKLDSALFALDQVIMQFPDYTIALLNRGVIHEKRNEIDLALQDYTSAIESNPTSGLSYRYRAVLYLSLNQYSNAIKDLNLATTYLKKDGLSYFLRAKAYQKNRQFELAKIDAEKATKYNFKEAKVLLKELDLN